MSHESYRVKGRIVTNWTPIILTRVSDICCAGFGWRRMANWPKRANMGLKKKMGRRQKTKKWVLPIVAICSDYKVVEE